MRTKFGGGSGRVGCVVSACLSVPADWPVSVPDQIVALDVTQMDLLPFAAAHAVTVAGWPTSSREVVMWCGRQEFPVLRQTITDWQRDDDVQAHILVEDERVVGYGELWFDAEEDEVELARIIVAPDIRGKGLGRVLVRGLLAQALGAGYSDVFMRVHPDNETALRCYREAGFVSVDAGLAESWNAAQLRLASARCRGSGRLSVVGSHWWEIPVAGKADPPAHYPIIDGACHALRRRFFWVWGRRKLSVPVSTMCALKVTRSTIAVQSRRPVKAKGRRPSWLSCGTLRGDRPQRGTHGWGSRGPSPPREAVPRP